MRIERLRVNNFRCFENLEIRLHPKCNVLVGINGAGTRAGAFYLNDRLREHGGHSGYPDRRKILLTGKPGS